MVPPVEDDRRAHTPVAIRAISGRERALGNREISELVARTEGTTREDGEEDEEVTAAEEAEEEEVEEEESENARTIRKRYSGVTHRDDRRNFSQKFTDGTRVTRGLPTCVARESRGEPDGRRRDTRAKLFAGDRSFSGGRRGDLCEYRVRDATRRATAAAAAAVVVTAAAATAAAAAAAMASCFTVLRLIAFQNGSVQNPPPLGRLPLWQFSSSNRIQTARHLQCRKSR